MLLLVTLEGSVAVGWGILHRTAYVKLCCGRNVWYCLFVHYVLEAQNCIVVAGDFLNATVLFKSFIGKTDFEEICA